MRRAGTVCATVLILGACWSEEATRPVAAAPEGAGALPAMRWAGEPGSEAWTRATLEALRGHGATLVSETPGDVDTWCPGYPEAAPEERRAFWSGLLSALSEYESTWRPDAVGGDGQWYGLVQIAPATATAYGCAATTGAALQDPEANLSCAVRILAETVPRDAVVSAEGGGVAADWAPFADPEKRADMAGWTSEQAYCR